MSARLWGNLEYVHLISDLDGRPALFLSGAIIQKCINKTQIFRCRFNEYQRGHPVILPP